MSTRDHDKNIAIKILFMPRKQRKGVITDGYAVNTVVRITPRK